MGYLEASSGRSDAIQETLIRFSDFWWYVIQSSHHVLSPMFAFQRQLLPEMRSGLP
jgi:hypothetical protein